MTDTLATYFVSYEPRPHHEGKPYRVMCLLADGSSRGVDRFKTQSAAKAYATKRTNLEKTFNM